MKFTKLRIGAVSIALIMAYFVQYYGGHNDIVFATVPYINSIVSTDSSGNQGNNTSTYPAISKDGKYVAFISSATNLVSGDTNGKDDVFVKNTQTGAISRVDVTSGGVQANGSAVGPVAISYDGRYVGFASMATNLVSGDTNAKQDVFIHDMQSGTTELISQSSGGTIANDNSDPDISISRDGRYVVFASYASNLISGDTNGQEDVFVRDRAAGTTTRLSTDNSGNQGNYSSSSPAMSCDGSVVAFVSDATNLVSGDANSQRDLFVVNRIGGFNITDVTIGGNGSVSRSESPRVSCDGSTIVFASTASNLVSGDTNSAYDLFAYDVTSGSITRESVSSSGAQSSMNVDDYGFGVSGDGRYITFVSPASDLVSGDTNSKEDVFLRDRTAGTTEIVSKRSSTVQTTDTSRFAGISPDGQYVTFMSLDTGLVANDTNLSPDIFMAQSGASPCAL